MPTADSNRVKKADSSDTYKDYYLYFLSNEFRDGFY